jgi:ATP synthase protein I
MSDDKLQSLDDRIDQAKRDSTIAPPPQETVHDNPGMRAGSEFLAYVIAGGLLGWAIDHFVGTMPWGMVVMILLGFGMGIYRANKRLTGK